MVISRCLVGLPQSEVSHAVRREGCSWGRQLCAGGDTSSEPPGAASALLRPHW